MSRAQLIASRALWRARELAALRRVRWNQAHRKPDDPKRKAAWEAYAKAQAMRVHRDRQLAKGPVAGISQDGVDLVKRFEGFRSKPYRDAVGVWTIGYGETRGVGPHTKPVTEHEAASMLRHRLERDYFPAVHRFDGLNQHQADALTSFVYNVGPGALGPDTGIGKALRAHRYHDAADELLKWNRGGGHVLEGLTTRRKAERALFLS